MPTHKQLAEASVAAELSGLSLRQNFAWTLTGNVVYAMCQWAMVIALAKWTNASMIGQFALGLAIATPVLMFANLQLRAVQAVDTERRYAFGDYLGLRTLTTLAGVALITLAAWVTGSHLAAKLVILAVGAAKAIESISDVFFGLFQLNNRLDQIGKSMVTKGVVSLLALSATLYVTRNVLWGVIALALGWLAVLILFDIPRGVRFLSASRTGQSVYQAFAGRWLAARPHYQLDQQSRLIRLAFPLGVVMTLISVNMNIPRYFVHSHAGEKSLGIYSTMAYIMVAVVTIADAMGNSATPRLSRLYAAGELSRFVSLVLKLLGLGLIFGVAGVLVAYLVGPQLLAFLYGPEYAAHAHVFVWIMVAAGIGAIASLLTYCITAAKCFRPQVPMFALVVSCNFIACSILVPASGLTGAAVASVISSLTHTIVAAGVLGYLVLGPSSGSRDSAPVPGYDDDSTMKVRA
jgi:O-antigen/teichoic acid export membrane protein